MATSSTTKLLIATMDALKVQFPSLFAFGTDFKEEPVALNQQVNARIRKRPTVQTYDGTTGYFANEANAKALTEDVPVTFDSTSTFLLVSTSSKHSRPKSTIFIRMQ